VLELGCGGGYFAGTHRRLRRAREGFLSWKRPNIGSRMNREVHVRIWERPEVRILRATRHQQRFPSPNLNGRCRFSKRTLVGPPGNRQDAPIADVPALASAGSSPAFICRMRNPFALTKPSRNAADIAAAFIFTPRGCAGAPSCQTVRAPPSAGRGVPSPGSGTTGRRRRSRSVRGPAVIARRSRPARHRN
jgi:hypothetical protein